MRQIHLLTETEFKQRFDRETLESLFENSHPSALKEFSIQLKIWAQEKMQNTGSNSRILFLIRYNFGSPKRRLFVLSLDLEKSHPSFHLKFFQRMFGGNRFTFHLFRTNPQ
ncbi:hypothetical protein LEP1GSC127_3894 [Leptospira kirschneri str. 200801925]|nr:hypothetical protein LEP1GSC127_3894 [Leptospira kirschneri str. 200801925]